MVIATASSNSAPELLLDAEKSHLDRWKNDLGSGSWLAQEKMSVCVNY
jgi:hypothetical protein